MKKPSEVFSSPKINLQTFKTSRKIFFKKDILQAGRYPCKISGFFKKFTRKTKGNTPIIF